jgi:hypothetical protein
MHHGLRASQKAVRLRDGVAFRADYGITIIPLVRQVRSVVLLHFVGRGPRLAVVMYEVGFSTVLQHVCPPVLRCGFPSYLFSATRSDRCNIRTTGGQVNSREGSRLPYPSGGWPTVYRVV